MKDQTSASNMSSRRDWQVGAYARLNAADPELLEALLVEATEQAPGVDDPSLASDADLEAHDLQALGASSGGSDAPPKTQSGCPTKTATERCQKTCGGCRG